MIPKGRTLLGHGNPPPPPLPPRPATAAITPFAPAPPSAAIAPASAAIEIDISNATTKANGRGRTLALGAGGVTLAIVALLVGLHAFRRTPPAPVALPKVAAAPAPPAIAVAPLEAPAPAREAAPEAPAAPAPAALKAPRVRRHAATHAERASAPKRRPAHKRTVAVRARPAGDRAGARAAYQRGNDLLLTGNAAGAIDAYQDAVRLAPSDPVGYRGLGLAYEKEGKSKDAIAAFVSYLKLSHHARDREVIARRLYRLTHTD